LATDDHGYVVLDVLATFFFALVRVHPWFLTSNDIGSDKFLQKITEP